MSSIKIKWLSVMQQRGCQSNNLVRLLLVKLYYLEVGMDKVSGKKSFLFIYLFILKWMNKWMKREYSTALAFLLGEQELGSVRFLLIGKNHYLTHICKCKVLLLIMSCLSNNNFLKPASFWKIHLLNNLQKYCWKERLRGAREKGLYCHCCNMNHFLDFLLSLLSQIQIHFTCLQKAAWSEILKVAVRAKWEAKTEMPWSMQRRIQGKSSLSIFAESFLWQYCKGNNDFLCQNLSM